MHMKTKPMKPLRGACILVLGCLLSRMASAVSYEATGVVEQSYFQGDGSQGLVTNWFRVAVSDRQAVIRTGGMTDPAVEFFEYSCDGSESALLIKYFEDYRPPGSDKHFQLLCYANLFVNSGVVPEYGFGLITPVWLAYASSGFYQRSDPHHTEPVFSMGSGFRANHLTVESRWQFAPEAPRMLAWMVDFSDGNQYHEDEGKLLKERLPPPFDKPATNAFVSVLSWTNFGKLHLPLEWRVVQYKVNLNELSLEPRITTHGYTLTVSNGTSRVDFRPEFPLITRVIDRTFQAHGLPLREYGYITTNGRILTIPELSAQVGFQANLAAAGGVVGSPSKPPVVFVAIIILISLAAACALWRFRRKLGS